MTYALVTYVLSGRVLATGTSLREAIWEWEKVKTYTPARTLFRLKVTVPRAHKRHCYFLPNGTSLCTWNDFCSRKNAT